MIRQPAAASVDDERSYHHGHLRDALVEAGFALARTGGPNAVLLRAVTREAQVSHNAAYRHFANQEDLLAAVSDRCLLQLGRLMIERSDRVTVRGAKARALARLRAIGRAYIDFARTEPGWFRTAFSAARAHSDGPPSPPPNEPPADAGGTNPFFVLLARLDALVEVGALTAQRRQGAEYVAWSAVHGLSSLLLDGPLRDLPEPEVERAIEAVLDGVSRGLE